MRRGCEQEYGLLRSLLSDSYGRYRRITHVGGALVQRFGSPWGRV